jgi:ferrous-iron efflux pump FieF
LPDGSNACLTDTPPSHTVTALPDGSHRHPDEYLLRLASTASPLVALTLIGLKLWGWWSTSSVAMLGSLADSLLDLIASLITFFAVRIALTPPDDEHRFGHGKSEAIAAVMQSVLISVSALVVVLEAIQRLLVPAAVAAPGAGLVVIALSLLLTLCLVTLQRVASRRTGSRALAADEAHYRTDLFAGLAVAVAIVASGPGGWSWVDPAVGVLVAAYLVNTAIEVARGAVQELLDEELPEPEREAIRQIVLAHPMVLGLHDLRTRRAGRRQFIQVHLELDPDRTLADAHAIGAQVERDLVRRWGDAEVLIHLDPAGEPEPGHAGTRPAS